MSGPNMASGTHFPQAFVNQTPKFDNAVRKRRKKKKKKSYGRGY